MQREQLLHPSSIIELIDVRAVLSAFITFKFADKYLKGEFTTTWKTQNRKLQFQGKTKYHWKNPSMAHVFTIKTI